MYRPAISLLSLPFLSAYAFVDQFYTLVGFECDRQTDRLIVRYRGASDEKGKSMVEQKSQTDWEPGTLIASMKDPDHIGKLSTVKGSCKLRHAVYQLRIGPTPGNFNIQGRCGGAIAAWVEVRRGEELVLPRYELEGCHDTKAPVTTEIVFSPLPIQPVFKTVLPAEFYNN
jgi:hypothetical protein